MIKMTVMTRMMIQKMLMIMAILVTSDDYDCNHEDDNHDDAGHDGDNDGDDGCHISFSGGRSVCS